MPTDTKLDSLVLNVLTEEQYADAEKNENELYLIEGDEPVTAAEMNAAIANAIGGAIGGSY